jgi:hypothetical protein
MGSFADAGVEDRKSVVVDAPTGDLSEAQCGQRGAGHDRSPVPVAAPLV